MLERSAFLEQFIECVNNLDGDCPMIKEQLEQWLAEGLDINKKYAGFRSDSGGPTSALLARAEFRDWETMKLLLDHGANPNDVDENGYNVIESVLIGHSPFYLEWETSCEETLRLLMNYQPELKIRRRVLNECQVYQSSYIREFLANCRIIEDSSLRGILEDALLHPIATSPCPSDCAKSLLKDALLHPIETAPWRDMSSFDVPQHPIETWLGAPNVPLTVLPDKIPNIPDELQNIPNIYLSAPFLPSHPEG